MTRYSLKLLVFISAIISAIFGCNSSPTASNSDWSKFSIDQLSFSNNLFLTLSIAAKGFMLNNKLSSNFVF